MLFTVKMTPNDESQQAEMSPGHQADSAFLIVKILLSESSEWNGI